MKAAAFVLLFVFCAVECRKTVVPINKNANIDFINMEAGGGVRPGARPSVVQPIPAPVPAGPPSPGQAPTPAPKIPVTTPTAKLPPVTTAKPQITTVKPVQPNPRPGNSAPVSNPITTPGPGTVKQLVTFYDAQGKGSPIRPYSYSQSVKQG